MSILNDKLEKIIAESGINFYEEEVGNELKSRYIPLELNEALQKMWYNLPDDANVAVYGLGHDSQYLFDAVDLAGKNLICMVDNNPQLTDFEGYPVIRCEDIPAHKIDTVIITSRSYADEMKSSVKKVSPDCGIINMWDVAFNEGYFFLKFYLLSVSKKFFYSAFLLNSATEAYEKTRDFRYLLYIISVYLGCKDIKNALVSIDKYISLCYPDTGRMLAFKNSLLDLLGEIRIKLESNKKPHTIVLIADCMKSNEITPCQTPFLYELGKNSIQCPNAYSHVGWTSPSILTIIKQKIFLDSRLYKEPLLTGTEPLFEYLSKSNTDFAYYWPFRGKRLFENTPDKPMLCTNGCADTMWNYLCSAFENDKKTLSFLHFLETHVPCFCLPGCNLFCQNTNYYSDCVKYVDSQIGFLFDLLPNSTKLLFCSDHGKRMGNSLSKSTIAYWSKRYNIPYLICDRKTRGRMDNRLVSHLDTVDILINLLNDKPAFENIKRRALVETNEEFLVVDFLLVAYVELYGKLKAFCAHKSFISETDRYVISYDGEEGYFLLPDDDGINLIDDPKYADRINWFRENVNTEFPDFSDDNGRYNETRKYFDVDKKNPRK